MNLQTVIKIKLFWLFLLIYSLLNSQNCYDSFLRIKKNKNSTNQFQVNKLLSDCYTDTYKKIEIAHYFSIYFFKNRQISLATKYAQLEVNYHRKIKEKNISYEQALFNLGKFLYREKKYDEAIKCFSEITNLKISLNKTAVSYNELNICYREKGELYKAIKFAEKGINLLENTDRYSHLFSMYINTSNTYNIINSKKSSFLSLNLLEKGSVLQIDHKELQKKDNYFFLNSSKANSFSNLYEFYKKKDIGNKKLIETFFGKCKKHHEKNLEIGFKYKDSSLINSSYINLGDLYLTEEKDSALYFLKKSLDFHTNNNYTKNISYNNISKFYLQKGYYKKALLNINKSLNHIFNIDENKLNFTPSYLQLLDSNKRKLIFSYLKNKIKILNALHSETKNKNYLNQAIETVNIADRLVNIIIDYSSETNNKLLWRKKVSEAYLLGTKAAYLLKDINTMFYFMEKSKALLLLQDIKQNITQNNLPKKITYKRLTAKKSILQLDDFINKHQENNTYTKEKDSLFFLKKEYETFNDSLKLIYPDYFNEKSDIDLVSLKDTKNKLDDNTILISYISNNINIKEKALFGLAISKNKEFAFEVENFNELVDDLKIYKNLIKQPFTIKEDINKFKNISYNLYNNLFPSDSLKEAIKGKRLIIIPDVTFENIPFEALNANKEGLNYLIENNTISYAYSFSFLTQNTAIKRKVQQGFSAFAPINFSNNLSPLLTTKNEITQINATLNGTIFLNENATKDSFIKNSTDFKIIHLATHAKSSNKPEIYFSKDTLKLHELYTHKINADLVTLSACETNLGEVNQGEGVFSLARGFCYSGANTVISSLWNVNDTSTSFLMTNFYENLKNNHTKVDALTNAKRKYLKEHSLSERSPYYWASFVLIGDTSKTFENNYSLYFFLAFIIFLITIFLFFKIKK